MPPHKCSEASPKTHWHSCNTALMQEPTSSFWTLQSYLQAVTALSFTRTSCQLTRTKVKMWPRQLIFGFLHLLDFADQQKLWQMRGGGLETRLTRFSRTTISEFTENGQKKRKYPVSGSCVDRNALLMSEVRGEWADWWDDRKATVTQINTRYNQGM